jgi:hypothetical protein
LAIGVFTFAVIAGVVSINLREVTALVPVTAILATLVTFALIRALQIRAFQSLKLAGEPLDEPGQPVQVPAGNLVSGLTMGRLTSMDGTSNIIMMSTRYSVCGNSRTRYAANVDGSNLPDANVAGGFMGAGSYSAAPSPAGTLSDMFQIAPTQATCVPAPGVFGHSFRTSGMSVALADGSVKHINVTMSPKTFSQALCPGDGRELGPDWAED